MSEAQDLVFERRLAEGYERVKLGSPMEVWVLFDSMNEEPIGVFSTEAKAQEAANAHPQGASWLAIIPFDIDGRWDA